MNMNPEGNFENKTEAGYDETVSTKAEIASDSELPVSQTGTGRAIEVDIKIESDCEETIGTQADTKNDLVLPISQTGTNIRAIEVDADIKTELGHEETEPVTKSINFVLPGTSMTQHIEANDEIKTEPECVETVITKEAKNEAQKVQVCSKKDYSYSVSKEEYIEPSEDFLLEEIPSKDRNSSVEQVCVQSKCYLCKYSFKDKTKYKWHMLKHSNEKKIMCLECKKNYLKKSQLLVHMITTHTKGLSCNLCKKTFAEKNMLELHISIHTIGTYSCDVCRENFDHKSQLTIHLRKHVGGKVHKCNKCNKEFDSPSGLIYHERTHSGEKPFSCDICGANFLRSSKLLRHRTIHNKVTPHKCKLCEKTFVRLTDMQHHSKIHKM